MSDKAKTPYLDGAPGARIPAPAGTPNPQANIYAAPKKTPAPSRPIKHRGGNGQFKKAPKGK